MSSIAGVVAFQQRHTLVLIVENNDKSMYRCEIIHVLDEFSSAHSKIIWSVLATATEMLPTSQI
jgi:hypothetical protein